MVSLFSELIKQIIFYLVFGFFVLGGMNFWTKGFLVQWFQVKASRDKKVLVKVRSLTDDYFRTGEISDSNITYTTRAGKEKTFSLPDTAIYRSMGVHCVSVDEQRDCADARDFSKVSGFDGETNSNMHKRALTAPKLGENKTNIIIGCLVVIILGVLVLGIISFQWHNQLLQAISGLKTVATSNSVSPVSGGV